MSEQCNATMCKQRATTELEFANEMTRQYCQDCADELCAWPTLAITNRRRIRSGSERA